MTAGKTLQTRVVREKGRSFQRTWSLFGGALLLCGIAAACSSEAGTGLVGPTTGDSTKPAHIPSRDASRGDAVIAPLGGGFDRSVWRVDVSKAPVHELSDIQVGGLTSRLAQLYGGNAAFSVYQYGVSWVTVAADQPRTTVHWYDCQDKGRTPMGLFGPSGQIRRCSDPRSRDTV